MLHGIITLNGMYKWDNTLFDNILIPSALDKSSLITTILSFCGRNEVLYGDYAELKSQIENFFTINYQNFSKLTDILSKDYDATSPYIHNRTLTETETSNDTSNRTVTNNETAENQVSAFNQRDYSNDRKSTTNTNGNENKTDKGNRGLSVTENIEGNIGNRTFAEMISQEIDLRMSYNVYEIISLKFENEITIPVY